MKIRIDAVIFYIALLLSIQTIAQKPDIRFEYLGAEEGLLQNMVSAITKDHYGYLWFGTDDGLNKYDGNKVTLYRNNPKNPGSISANLINCVYEDSKGRLWVATDAGGLNLYDRNANSFIRFVHSDGVPSSLRDNAVRSICEDANGHLWIGTQRGLDMMNEGGGFKHYTIDPSKKDSVLTERVYCMLRDANKNLWIGTEGGLALCNTKTKSFSLFRHNAKDPRSISDNWIKALTLDDKGTLWIGTQNGLNKWHPDNGVFEKFFKEEKNLNSLAHNFIWALASDRNGNLWVGTESGLDLFEIANRKFFHYKNIPGDENSLPHNSLRSLYVDNREILWLGCFAGGVRKYDKQLFHFSLYKPVNSNPVTTNLKMAFSFAEMRNGNILIGSDGGGLNIFNKKDYSFYHFATEKGPSHCLPQGHAVLAILADTNGDDFWVGTYDYGLSRYHAATKTFTHYLAGSDNKHLSDGSVYALMRDRKGNIWIATNNGGVNILDVKTNTFTSLPVGNRDGRHLVNGCTRSLYEDSEGKIWIGTYGTGINIYDPSTGSFEYLDKENNRLTNNVVLSIHSDAKGNVWVGTMGGLNFYDGKKRQFTAITEEDGLANNYVNSIQLDMHGLLWLSTKRGISSYNSATRKIKNYSLANGLQGYEFLGGSGCTSRTGEIYFGGVNGFNVFNPSHIAENLTPPPVMITGFQLANKPVAIGKNSVLKKDISITDSIVLSYGSSMLSFEFSALNFSAPERNQYAYMLEGFDKEWIYCGSSKTATYTNIDPGKYVFRVKASNNDGVWNETGAAVTLIITPPFWQTWWFRLLMAIAVIALVYTLYFIRVNSIRVQKMKLEQQVTQQTKQLVILAGQEQEARKKAEEANLVIQQTNKALELKNQELEQFAYVASHDLQEPLRTATSFVELLQKEYKDMLDARGDKYLMFILQSSERMRTLIKDLLEYSRIGRKKEITHIDCNELIEQVLFDLQVSIKEKSAQVNFSSLPQIDAYPTELKQLFQNLITNAIKFQKPGESPKIALMCNRKQGAWEFVCKDNGIGIDEKHSERIFVIFQRLHTRSEYEGSGIGLANCKKIVELHGGKIWVESAAGEGSEFHFTIPDAQIHNIPLN